MIASRDIQHLAPLLVAPLLVALAATSAALGGGTLGPTWYSIAALSPAASGGAMLLLSDGTVMCKVQTGPAGGEGNGWVRLRPNAQGSYIAGTWSTLASMGQTRYYFSSQVLKDGRVYVAGGEYGTGLANAEVYNPLTNAWTPTPAPGGNVSDANSEMLPDGRVLQALVAGTLRTNVIYNPVTNLYSPGPSCLGIHNESAWVKLRDSSILMVDRHAFTSERYRPTTNTWTADANVPVALYDDFGFETGGAVLLPDGRAIHLGATGNTAYYTPPLSGNVGSWVAGPSLPAGQGTPDAPLAMMHNGKILCATAPLPVSGAVFSTPTSFYELDTNTNSFTQVGAPTGGFTVNEVSYAWTFLCLPDGGVMCARLGSTRYWIYYTGGGLGPLAAGKPTISSVTREASGAYRLLGTQFNGISQGASYGDDWQMNTNYPIVRLTSALNANVHYCRTFDWSSTGVQTGSARVSTLMTVPSSVPYGVYSLFVTANGIASDARPFLYARPNCAADIDFDGLVGGGDLALLLAGWLTNGGPAGLGDLDGSGLIDGGDLALMLGSWGVCPP